MHGITLEFLDDKPRFHEIAETLTEYLAGAELIIHNALRSGLLNHELRLVDAGHTALEERRR